MNAMSDPTAFRTPTCEADRQRLQAGDARVLSAGRGAWIVVLTKPGKEFAVRERLRHDGFEVYLPLRLARGRERGVYPLPALPRFVFVRFRPEAVRWQNLFTTVGVQRVLCDPSAPRGVKDAFIVRLQAEENGGYLRLGPRVDRPAHVVAAWKPGDKIDGIPGLVEALLVEVVDERRGKILASVLGSDSSARITIDLRKQTAWS